MTDTMRSAYRELTNDDKIRINNVKAQIVNIYSYLEQLDRVVEAHREIAIAKTKLEEACMWAVKGLTA